VAWLDLKGPKARGSPEQLGPGQAQARRQEQEEEDPSNWVAYFDGAQSWEGLGVGVLLVSPTGQHHKYIIQLAFPREGCASSIAECEGLLAGLRITVGLGISCLSIRGDSQLTVSQAEGVRMSPLMKEYVDKVQKLRSHFCSLKLKHVPRGQDAIVKELSQIAAKGLPVPTGATVKKLPKPSTTPEEEDTGAPPTPE
jgi:ribonuclease HI